jgi:hypothetical protein
MVTQEAEEAGVQAHSEEVVTVAVPEPPSAGMVAEAGATLYVQAMPAWVTENVARPPLTEIVPTR